MDEAAPPPEKRRGLAAPRSAVWPIIRLVIATIHGLSQKLRAFVCGVRETLTVRTNSALAVLFFAFGTLAGVPDSVDCTSLAIRHRHERGRCGWPRQFLSHLC